MLGILHRGGYVAIADSPCDGRSSAIEITEQGRQMLGIMAAKSAGFIRELFAGISGKDFDIAADVIIEMVDKLNKMREEPP